MNPIHLHIGLGQFHKAHQAVYTQIANTFAAQQGHAQFDLISASLRTSGEVEKLRASGFNYEVIEHSAEGSITRPITCMKETLFAVEEFTRLDELLSSDDVKVITLTLTEKGYYRKGGQVDLDILDDNVQADLNEDGLPRTIYGWLERGFTHRMTPVTVVSCDNLNHNGKTIGSLFKQFLAHKNPTLVQWVHENVAFPSSMVDRIVPAQSNSLKVETEGFRQWVIEDHFFTDKPMWERAGVEFVPDVEDFEKMKLRILNGSHSAIAYLGLLAGLETVDQVVEHPILKRWIVKLMREELTVGVEVSGYDLGEYQRMLIERFRNPHLKHKLAQIATDGSQKIPQRWLEAYSEKPGEMIPFSIAAWMLIMLDRQRGVRDPKEDFFAELEDLTLDDQIEEIVYKSGIFPENLRTPEFVDKVQALAKKITRDGILPTLEGGLNARSTV